MRCPSLGRMASASTWGGGYLILLLCLTSSTPAAFQLCFSVTLWRIHLRFIDLRRLYGRSADCNVVEHCSSVIVRPIQCRYSQTAAGAAFTALLCRRGLNVTSVTDRMRNYTIVKNWRFNRIYSWMYGLWHKTSLTFKGSFFFYTYIANMFPNHTVCTAQYTLV